MTDRDRMRNDHSESTRRFVCPKCSRPVAMRQEGSRGLPRFFPFCSERCKLIDLGAWFDTDYRIASKPDEDGEESAGEIPSVGRENTPE